MEAPPHGRDLRLRSVWEAVSDPTVEVVSVDVFDTLVWRTIAQPVDAFPIVGKRLALAGLLAEGVAAGVFGRIREEAERRARAERLRTFGDPEVNMIEIYAAMPEWIFAEDTDLARVIDLEVDVERDLVVPDLEIVDLLLHAATLGKTLVVVSDNYLGEQHLRSLLEQPMTGSIVFTEVFCSCDHRTGKGDDLFARVLSRLRCNPRAVLHVGDNELADVECPERLGIRTVHFAMRSDELEEVVERERALSLAGPRIRFDDAGITALRGKVAASGWGPADPAVADYWTWGATVLGPVLSGFADWLCKWAERNKAPVLHCLMREGTLLTDLVNASATYRDDPLYAEPLWLNRRVCLRAVLGDDTEEAVERLAGGRTAPTIRAFLGQLGLTLRDVPALAAHAETRLEDPVLREALISELDDIAIRTAIGASSRTLADRIVRLLERAADDAGRVVLVDLGWGASIQGLAQQLLKAAGSEVRTTGLYLLTDFRAVGHMTAGAEAHGFLAHAGMPRDLVRQFMRSPEVLEQICSAAVGSQVSLDEDLEPIVGEPEAVPLQLRQAKEVRDGARAFHAFAGRYRSVFPGKLPPFELADDILRPVLLRATTLPADHEILLFGTWHHDEGRGSTRRDQIVGPDDLRLGSHGHPGQLRDMPMNRLYWPYGVIAASGEEQSGLVGAALAGLVPWDALSSPLENGAFEVEVTQGIDIDSCTPIAWSEPRRNLRGRSLAAVSLRAPAIHELEIKLSHMPHLVRLDWLILTCWEQGSETVRRVVAADSDVPLLSPRPGYLAMGQNTFVTGDHHGRFVIDVARLSEAIIFRVDVECGFAYMPLPGSVEFAENDRLRADLERTQRVVDGLTASASWRVTRPLRAGKELRRRLG